MRYALWVSVVLGLLCLAACEDKGDAFTPTPAFVEKIARLADETAQAEMKKFNAAEQKYKGTVTICNNLFHPDGSDKGAYFKGYRDFTHYEVLDIRRTDSLLKPIDIELRFHYTLYTTEPRSNTLPDSEARAALDVEYKPLRERQATRTYRFDKDGNYVHNLPEYLPPDNIFLPDKELVLAPDRYHFVD